MARQDQEEQDEFEKNEADEKMQKRNRAMVMKHKAKLTKALQDLEDPNAVKKIEQLEQEKIEARKLLALKKLEEKKKLQKKAKKKRIDQELKKKVSKLKGNEAPDANRRETRKTKAIGDTSSTQLSTISGIPANESSSSILNVGNNSDSTSLNIRT